MIIITVLLSRHICTASCPPGHLPPCCLASILDSDPVGCLLPTSPHTPHSAPLSRLIGEAEELSAADNSSPHRVFVRLGFSSRAFPFSTKNGVPKSKLTSCCLGMLFPSRRYVLFSQLRCLMSSCIFSRTVLHSYLFCLSVVQKTIVGWPA